MPKILKNGQPVAIRLTTGVKQDGNIEQHLVEVMGQIVEVNEKYYLRYSEEEAGQVYQTTIKIDAEGPVTIMRDGEDVSSKMHFSAREETLSVYRTVYGNMKIKTNTKALSLNLKSNPFQGQLDLEYHLYNGEELLGNYRIDLSFTV